MSVCVFFLLCFSPIGYFCAHVLMLYEYVTGLSHGSFVVLQKLEKFLVET